MTDRAEYMAAKRRADPLYRSRERLGVQARNRALERLRRNHSEEFNEILEAERSALGLPLRHTTYRGRPIDA